MTVRTSVFSVCFVAALASMALATPPTQRLERVVMSTPGMQAFVVDLEDWQLRILTVRDGTRATSRASEVGKRHAASLVVNGGFFDPQDRSLGLLIDQGKRINPVRKADWGIFSVSGKEPRASIVHTRTWRRQKKKVLPEFAIQSGPRLVVSGRALSLKPHWARRTAIGIQRGGRKIVVLVSSQSISMTDLAQAFLEIECPYALNLDGGSSTQLWSPSADVKPVIGLAVPNFVAVFPRHVP